YGWSPKGSRARRRDFFVRGKRYSILPALSRSGILAVDVFERPLTTKSFNQFIRHVLDRMNPFPAPNSVLVMDNASIHHSDELRDMIEARYAFSCIKAWIRSNRDYVLGELGGGHNVDPYDMIWKAVFTVTAEKAEGWFRHSGYI
ncbi:hypothetical protein HYDPIDRAFT_67322, partial [Hydnomerulius pinastri MD-312]